MMLLIRTILNANIAQTSITPGFSAPPTLIVVVALAVVDPAATLEPIEVPASDAVEIPALPSLEVDVMAGVLASILFAADPASEHGVLPLLPPMHNPLLAPQRAPGGQYQSLLTATHSLLGLGAPPHVAVAFAFSRTALSAKSPRS
jgi:hypothetical protein